MVDDRVVEDLLRLPDADFITVVNADTREDTELCPPGFSEALRAGNQRLIQRWLDVLISQVNGIQDQITDRKADLLDLQQECLQASREDASSDRKNKSRYFEAKNEFEDWRARALIAKRHLVERSREAKVLLRESQSGNDNGTVFMVLGRIERKLDQLLAERS